jgi:hypothetical protein
MSMFPYESLLPDLNWNLFCSEAWSVVPSRNWSSPSRVIVVLVVVSVVSSCCTIVFVTIYFSFVS